LARPAEFAGYQAAVERWQADVRLSLAEWLEDHPELGLGVGALPVYLCGACAGQPHLLAFLNQLGSLKFEAWEQTATAAQPWPMADYLVAYGAALQTLGRAPRGISLLPPEARRQDRLHRRLAWLQAAGLGVLLAATALLAVGLGQKQSLIGRKSRLTERTRTALQTANNVDLLYRRLHGDYENVYPLLRRQRETFETLQAFAAVRAARTNDDFWYVLFADAASYAAGTAVPPAAVYAPTDAAAVLTNLLARTNPPAPRREFVAELCIPREGEPLRRLLSDTLATLSRNPVFERVDALPPERKREWVDPRVFVSNRVFAVVMEAAGRELALPAPPAPRIRPAATNGPRRSIAGPRLERAGGQNP
jgi:hypothetical protein